MPTSTSETTEIDADGVIYYKETTVETDMSGNVISVSYKRGVYGPTAGQSVNTTIDGIITNNWTPNVIAQYGQKIENLTELTGS